jgi:hypothetical protein
LTEEQALNWPGDRFVTGRPRQNCGLLGLSNACEFGVVIVADVFSRLSCSSAEVDQ